MKKSYILIIAFLLIVLNVCPVAAGDENPVEKVSADVLEYFVPASGTVENAGDGPVTLSLKGESGIKGKGRLTIFREGEPFYHPVTNEKLGNTEYAAGRVEIKEKAEDGLYTASLVSGSALKGDKARVPTSRIKLAFFQERKSDWTLSELFYNSLKDSGRFDILESYTPSYEPEDLSRLARDLGAEAVLLFSTPVNKGEKSLNVKLFWSEDSMMFAEINETLDRDMDMAIPGDEFLSIEMIESEPWGTFGIKKGRMMGVGDINNNGTSEFVVSDGNVIRIYSQKKDLREEWSIYETPSEMHLSIDVLDKNLNGYAEIFITSIVNERELRSYVVEYHPSGVLYKIKENIPYFFRVTENKLLMQKYSFINGFTGPVFEAELKDGEYQPGTALNTPRGVNLYGFTFVDWQGSGKQQLTFDDRGYLHLLDASGSRIWKSNESYGKADISLKKVGALPGDPDDSWFVREKLITIKTDRGQEVLVVKKIPEVAAMPGLGFKAAEVYSLWWDGSSMEQRPLLKKLPGSVKDYWVEGKRLYLIAEGNVFGAIASAVSGDFSNGSVIYYYNIKEQ